VQNTYLKAVVMLLLISVMQCRCCKGDQNCRE